MGKSVSGVVSRKFTNENGVSYVLDLVKPTVVKGHEEKQVTMGGMKGFEMALQAARIDELHVGDKVFIEATGYTQPEDGSKSKMVNFAVEVTRDGKEYRGKTEDAKAPYLNAPFWDVEKNVASA